MLTVKVERPRHDVKTVQVGRDVERDGFVVTLEPRKQASKQGIAMRFGLGLGQ